MKITCTSKEFATLIRACERRVSGSDGCTGCVFLSICVSAEQGCSIEDAAKFEVREHG